MKAAGIIGALVIAGGAYAGYKYYEKYKKDHAELENDFSEYEEDDEKAFSANTISDFHEAEDPNKKYTSLNANKNKFVEVARNTFETAKGIVEPTKGMVKNIGEIITEKVDDSSVVANDYVSSVKEKVSTIVEETKGRFDVIEEDVLNRNTPEDDTADDVIIDIEVSKDPQEI